LIRITVPGEARPWRASQTVSKGGRTWTHREDGQEEQEHHVRHYASEAMEGHEIMEGPVVLSITIYRARGLKSMSGVKRDAALYDLVRPTTRPDSTNLCKAIEDGLSGVVFVDDSQVVETTIRKRYGMPPKVMISAKEWEPDTWRLFDFERKGKRWASWLLKNLPSWLTVPDA